MAVLFTTGTATPIIVIETDVAAIAPGAALDNLSVYVVGGTGGGDGLLEYALYATVGTVRTRVAQAQIHGSASPSLIAWQSVSRSGVSGGSQDEELTAGGTVYTVTVLDLSSKLPQPGAPSRQPVTVTIAGVNQFDTVADSNFSAALTVLPGGVGFLPTINGYTQLLDVAIDQTNLPPVTVTVAADCGVGSVQAIVKSVNMSGIDSDIASVFRNLRLPVATRYFVSVTNNGPQFIVVTLTAASSSIQIASGGAVVLTGDVIGVSSANTVIKWDNVPLDLPTMGAPTDAQVPIYDSATGSWRAITLSGGLAIDHNGVVTITPKDYALFFALMPGDNSATVAAGAAVQFPQNGPTSAGGITRLTPTTFQLAAVGNYEIAWQVSVSEAGQLQLAIGGVGLPSTVVGRATPTNQISGNTIITTIAPNSVLSVINPVGNPSALTITPIAGGTHAVSATLTIRAL